MPKPLIKKKTKRFTAKKSSSFGRMTFGITDTQTAAALGSVIAYWSQVEDRMVTVLHQLIYGCHQNVGGDIFSSRLMFKAIVSQQTRISTMRTLLQNSWLNETKSSEFDEIISEFEMLNTKRNRYVHSMYGSLDDGKTMICEKSMEAMSPENSREITPRELKEFEADLHSFHQRVLTLKPGDTQKSYLKVHRE